MSLPLLPAEHAQFSAIIDGILAKGDLETISSSKIRKALQAAVEVDIAPKKQAIQALIIERFDRANGLAAQGTEAPPPPATNGQVKPEKVKKEEKVKQEKRESNSPAGKNKVSPSTEDEDTAPPKKKRKRVKEVDDAKLAAMLQAQENRAARATRGGGNARKQKVARPRKKSEKKVKNEDDSELEVGSDGEVKEKPKKGGFHKQYNLSAPLADLVGAPTLSRPQTVKKIWEHIKAHDLQDPADKRQIRCDEKMQLVFKQDNVHMFTMNKLLGKHLYDLEE